MTFKHYKFSYYVYTFDTIGLTQGNQCESWNIIYAERITQAILTR